jgi:hypothetical protein
MHRWPVHARVGFVLSKETPRYRLLTAPGRRRDTHICMARRKNPEAVRLGRRGAKARMKKLTPEKRREVARTAAAARWKKPIQVGSKPAALKKKG